MTELVWTWVYSLFDVTKHFGCLFTNLLDAKSEIDL